MATERLILELRTKGSGRVSRNIAAIRKEASQANRTLALLRSTLVVVASARVISQFAQMADVLTNVRNRLRLVTNSTAQLNAVQQRLFQISQNTRSSFEANAVLFNRLARSTDGLGLTFNELLDVTRGITQAIAISGATSQEARNSLIQFSQGLAAGALRGDELRSVVEQLPRLADAIAKEFNVAGDSSAESLGVTVDALKQAQKEVQSLTGGALIAFAKANGGVLTTARVVKALQNELGVLDGEFAKIEITVAQAFERFNNQLILFIGGLTNSIKLGAQLDTVLTFIAKNLGIITASLLAIAAISVFNLLTGQLLRFGTLLAGVLGFLTTGFIGLGAIVVTPFLALGRAVAIAATGAILLTTAYVRAVALIATELGLLATRFGLLRLAIVSAWGGAMAFMAASTAATSRAVIVALGVIPATFALIVRSIRNAVVGLALLSTAASAGTAALTVLASAGRAALGLLAGGLLRLIPLVVTLGGAILSALLPAIAIAAALAAAFFAVRAAVEALEDRFGSLGDIFEKAVGGIFGALDGLVDGFSLLDDAIIDISISAVNGMIDIFETGVGAIIDLLNSIPGIDIDPPDLGRIENAFEGSADELGDILSENISRGVNEGFAETDTFKALEGVFNDIKGLITGGFLPSDFDDAQLKALLDQISGTRDGMVDLSSETGKAAKKFEELRAEVDPLVAGQLELRDAARVLTAAFGENFRENEKGAETFRLIAERIAGVENAEFKLARQLELVTQLQEEAGLSAEQAAIARQKFALEATREFDRTVGAVAPLIRAQRELAEITLFLEENQKRLNEAGLNGAEIKKRLARESFGLAQTEEQLNEQIQALIQNQDTLGLSSQELEVQVRKLRIAFLEQQRDAASGAERAYLKMLDDATNSAKFTEQVFNDAFDAISRQIDNFIETGEFKFDEFVRNIASQLIKLGTQQLFSAGGGFFSNLFGGSSGFGFFGGPSLGDTAGIGGLLGGLFGFANGGSFTVGAGTSVGNIPGLDNRIVAFRARDNEQVTVTTPGETNTAGQTVQNVTFNIQTPDADSFRRAEGNIRARMSRGLQRANQRNN